LESKIRCAQRLLGFAILYFFARERIICYMSHGVVRPLSTCQHGPPPLPPGPRRALRRGDLPRRPRQRRGGAVSSETSRAHIGTGRSPPCKESKSDESKTRHQNASVVILFFRGDYQGHPPQPSVRPTRLRGCLAPFATQPCATDTGLRGVPQDCETHLLL